MSKLRLIGISGLAVAAFSVSSTTTATAEDPIFNCPNKFEPVPKIALPPSLKDRDTNNNLIVCAKGPQGANQHYNVKDDKGAVVSPAEWHAQHVAQTAWLVTMALDTSRTYTLDPAPTDVVDDFLAP